MFARHLSRVDLLEKAPRFENDLRLQKETMLRRLHHLSVTDRSLAQPQSLSNQSQPPLIDPSQAPKGQLSYFPVPRRGYQSPQKILKHSPFYPQALTDQIVYWTFHLASCRWFRLPHHQRGTQSCQRSRGCFPVLSPPLRPQHHSQFPVLPVLCQLYP